MKTQEKDIKAPSVLLSFDIATRLGYYVRGTDKEVSGLGEIIYDSRQNLFVVTQLHLLEQECSTGETTLKPEALQSFLAEFIKQQKDPGLLKFHWHSHAKMSTFWSAVDDKFCEGWAADWMVALVSNHAGNYLARLEVRQPFVMSLPVTVYLESYHDADLAKTIQEEVNSKVKEVSKVITIPHNGQSAWIQQLDKELQQEMTELVKDFSEKFGRLPGKKERRAMRKRLCGTSKNAFLIGDEHDAIQEAFFDGIVESAKGANYLDNEGFYGV